MFRFLLLLISVVCASGFLNLPHRCTSPGEFLEKYSFRVIVGSLSLALQTNNFHLLLKIALSMSFDSEIGAQPPLGFWDPLGLLNNADQARFDRLRTVENKHGRISMLAVLGHLVTTAGGLFIF